MARIIAARGGDAYPMPPSLNRMIEVAGSASHSNEATAPHSWHPGKGSVDGHSGWNRESPRHSSEPCDWASHPSKRFLTFSTPNPRHGPRVIWSSTEAPTLPRKRINPLFWNSCADAKTGNRCGVISRQCLCWPSRDSARWPTMKRMQGSLKCFRTNNARSPKDNKTNMRFFLWSTASSTSSRFPYSCRTRHSGKTVAQAGVR